MYLFIWLCRIFVATCGVFICSVQYLYLWHAGSLVVACRLLVAVCMWDVVP